MFVCLFPCSRCSRVFISIFKLYLFYKLYGIARTLGTREHREHSSPQPNGSNLIIIAQRCRLLVVSCLVQFPADAVRIPPTPDFVVFLLTKPSTTAQGKKCRSIVKAVLGNTFQKYTNLTDKNGQPLGSLLLQLKRKRRSSCRC